MVSDNWTDPLYDSLFAQFGSIFGFTTAAFFNIIVYIFTHSIIVDLAVAVILENFELEEDEKRYGQVVQLVDRLERKNMRTEAGMFSWWNPYRYLKPSPEMLNVTFLPERLRSRIRLAYFTQFIQSAANQKNMVSMESGIGLQ